VLVLERGERRTHAWRVEHRNHLREESDATFVNATPEKPWWFTVAFGGGSNCWWGCTPRFLPSDFRMRSLYGVGRDWPVSYDELEGYYCDAEEIMSIAGPSEASPFRRSRPYPLPPHRLSVPDQVLQKAYPTSFFAQPTARPSLPTREGRPRCCGNGVCDVCPIDSKFTIINSLMDVYEDPRVTLRTGAQVLAFETSAGNVTAAVYRQEGTESRATGELFALGANALFNAHLLLRSGDQSPHLGKGLNEQMAWELNVELAGMAGFQGSTSVTGHAYPFYDGPHRRDRAAILVETWNTPQVLRTERGKWRHRLRIKCVAEVLPDDHSNVSVSKDDPDRPVVHSAEPGSYTHRAFEALPAALEKWLAPLPVERLDTSMPYGKTEAHLLGTTVMGRDPKNSVVDRNLRHHRMRNLLVLGGSVFPTSTPSNPTLTLCALALRAADQL
jgi:choline dehydrogenase-like flavoprotein